MLKDWLPVVSLRMRRRLLLAAAGAVLLGVTAAWLAHLSRQHHMEDECRRNLRHLYNALELYESRNGTLPGIEFYPQDTVLAVSGMLQVLEPYGLKRDELVCTSCPLSIQDTGLCYLWNTEANGKRILELREPVWLAVEVPALLPEMVKPHRGHYMVLYSDGRVQKESAPPAGLLR